MQTFRILRVLPFVMIKSYHTISIKRPIALIAGLNTWKNFRYYVTKNMECNIPPNRQTSWWKERKGKERKGKERKGKERKGRKERDGQDKDPIH